MPHPTPNKTVSIFDAINNSLPKQRQQPVQATTAPEESLKDIVSRWQKKETPEDSALILKKLKPTISSAINSYAPGMDSAVAIPAAKLALSAMRTYKPDFGTDPTTHAFHNLKRLTRYAAKRSNIIQQPEGVAAEKNVLSNLVYSMSDDLGREPTLEELADKTGWNTKKIDKLLATNRVISNTASLTDESREDTVTASDLTDDDYFEYVYASVGDVDKKIMEWASGLHGKKVLSNNDIAKRLKISAAAVSQRKAKIQEQLESVRGVL